MRSGKKMNLTGPTGKYSNISLKCDIMEKLIFFAKFDIFCKI
jgi:hypothetical protein